MSDSFLEKVRRSRNPVNIAVPNAGLAFGKHMLGILESEGADVYPLIYDSKIKFDGRELRDLTSGRITNASFNDMQEAELIAANLEVMDHVDALFIPGGGHLRQRTSLDGIMPLNQRIKVEMACYKAAIQKGMPVFGICAGAQAMVFYDGALIDKAAKEHWPNWEFIEKYPRLDPELRAQIEQGQMDRALAILPLGLGKGRYFEPMYEEMARTGHKIKIKKGSKLDELIGELVGEKKVCSAHFKDISAETLPDGVNITAHSIPDYAIEALERPSYKSFWMGVMFHPELSRELIEPLLKEFMKSAAQFRDAGRPR